MDVIVAAIIAAVVGLAIGIVAGYFVRKNISEAKIGEADSLAKNIIDQANKDAETMKKEKLLEAKEEIHKFRSDAEKENRERRNELQKYERRVIQKEESLDRKQQSHPIVCVCVLRAHARTGSRGIRKQPRPIRPSPPSRRWSRPRQRSWASPRRTPGGGTARWTPRGGARQAAWP